MKTKSVERKGLDDCLLTLQEGDILMVWKIDRPGRSLKHLVEIVTDLKERGVKFKSLHDGAIDTTTASGELIFNIFGSLAQFERRFNTGEDKSWTGCSTSKGETWRSEASISR